jgi:hypothetical protein
VDAVTVLLSLGAALGFAVAAALKHRSAGDLLESPTLSVPAVGRSSGQRFVTRCGGLAPPLMWWPSHCTSWRCILVRWRWCSRSWLPFWCLG